MSGFTIKLSGCEEKAVGLPFVLRLFFEDVKDKRAWDDVLHSLVPSIDELLHYGGEFEEFAGRLAERFLDLQTHTRVDIKDEDPIRFVEISGQMSEGSEDISGEEVIHGLFSGFAAGVVEGITDKIGQEIVLGDRFSWTVGVELQFLGKVFGFKVSFEREDDDDDIPF